MSPFVSEAFIVTQEDGRICQVSRSAETLFGYSCSELVGSSISNLVKPDDHGRLHRLQEASRNDLIVPAGEADSELWVVRKDGSETRVAVGVFFLETPAGVLFANVIRDVADTGHTEDKTKDRSWSAERLRRIADSLPVLIAYVDSDQRYRFNNATYELWFGRRREEIYGRRMSEILDERAYAIARPYIEAVLTGERVSFENDLSLQDGSTRTVHARFEPDVSPEGTVVGFYILTSDITERKRAELELRHTSDELETILNNVPTYIFYKDTKNMIVRVNRAAAQSLGLTTQDMEGQPTRVFYPEHADRYYRDDLEVIRSGMPKLGIVEPLRVSHNQTRWIETSKIPIRNGSGEVMGILVLASDITERKIAEQALHKAKDAAEQANSAKSRFLAAASHDLRQPLQAISLLTGSLSKMFDDAAAQRSLGELKSAVATMRDLLDTYLDVSKLDSGIIIPEISEFNINELLNNIALHLHGQAQGKGIILRVVPCNKIVRSDPTLLEQVLRNFVDNAIRYTESGKVLLGCRHHGSELHVEVWDTGVGIPEDQRNMIFEDFYQLDNPARDRRKGLGLGLAITRRVAHILDHQINVRSWLGKGSCFRVEVPVVRPFRQSDSIVGRRRTAAQREGLRVLVVDDDPSVLDSSRLFLEVSGFSVSTATSGVEALNQMSSDQIYPEFIVADYRLPDGETGVQVIHDVRRAAGKEIPAILVTGDTSVTALDEGELASCRILLKPIDVDELVRLMRQRS